MLLFSRSCPCTRSWRSLPRGGEGRVARSNAVITANGQDRATLGEGVGEPVLGARSGKCDVRGGLNDEGARRVRHERTRRVKAIEAYAKINLTLDVEGRRPDGFHALRSVMQELSLHDTLTIEPASTIEFACDDGALAGLDNLVVRAARLLQEEYGVTDGARLTLEKRIPSEAGLGGGSSDAAAALRGLSAQWGLVLSSSDFSTLGAHLGSDVPFFFHGPTALVTGRGEDVAALPAAPPFFAVLHKPSAGVSTRRVFSALSPTSYGGGGTDYLLKAIEAGLPVEEWPLSNGLQEAVVALYPQVGAALQRLRQAGATRPLMTGSGSTVYALFSDEASARALANYLVALGGDALTLLASSRRGAPLLAT